MIINTKKISTNYYAWFHQGIVCSNEVDKDIILDLSSANINRCQQKIDQGLCPYPPYQDIVIHPKK